MWAYHQVFDRADRSFRAVKEGQAEAQRIVELVRQSIRAAATWGMIVAVGGCAAPRAVSADGSLKASARPYDVDIPLPVGFRIVDRSSEEWASGPIRFVRHQYFGRGDRFAVRRFYRRQMPLIRWTAVEESQLDGRIAMRFRRGDETCRVIIDSRRSWLSQRIRIEVTIGPEGAESGLTHTTKKHTS